MEEVQNMHITKESFYNFAIEAPDAAIAMIYSLSKYHEKYRVTEWCMDILMKRGYVKEDMKGFSKDFTNFLHQMIQQDDL
jgi:hypothetical protein